MKKEIFILSIIMISSPLANGEVIQDQTREILQTSITKVKELGENLYKKSGNLIDQILIKENQAKAQENPEVLVSKIDPEQGLRNPFLPQLPKEPEPVLVESEPESPLRETPPVIRETPPSQPEVITAPSDLNLKGFIWDSDRPQAIINNEVYNIGDYINQAQIVAISKEGVELEYSGHRFLYTRDYQLIDKNK